MENNSRKVTKKISTIYSIENKVNGKQYIGQSENVNKRFSQHKYCLRKNIHNNKPLQRAWNKYGEENFVFTVLDKCAPEKADELEIYYINQTSSFGKGYNLTVGGSYVNNESIKKARGNSTRKCRYCGKRIVKGWYKYCPEHRYKCPSCGKRISTTGWCSDCKEKPVKCIKCGEPYSKKSNNQKRCPICYNKYRKNYQKEYMREKRGAEKELILSKNNPQSFLNDL